MHARGARPQVFEGTSNEVVVISALMAHLSVVNIAFHPHLMRVADNGEPCSMCCFSFTPYDDREASPLATARTAMCGRLSKQWKIPICGLETAWRAHKGRTCDSSTSTFKLLHLRWQQERSLLRGQSRKVRLFFHAPEPPFGIWAILACFVGGQHCAPVSGLPW